MKTRFWMTLVAAVLVFSFVGLVTAEEIIELRYACWVDPDDEHQDQKVRIEAFNEMHPNIRIIHEFAPLDQFNSQMMAWAAAGDLPDVMWVSDNLLFVRNGWLADLTPFLEADSTFDKDMFLGNILSPGTVRDRIFTLPIQLQAGFLLANLDTINHFGLRLPPPNWTTDQMYQFSQRMNRPSENYYGMEDPWIFWAHMPPAFSDKVQWDGLSLDGTEFLFDDPDVIEALKWALDFEKNNSAVSIGLADGSRPDPWGHEAFHDAYGNVSPFDQSKAAFRVDYSWSFNWLYENYEFPWDVIPYPAGPAKQTAPLIVDSMGISPTTKHPEAAFEFLRWMSYDADGWKARMEREQPVPYSLPTIENDEVWEIYFANERIPAGMRNVYDILPNGVVEHARHIPGIPEVWDIIGPPREDIRMGLTTYDDIFPTIINDQANQLMKEANEAHEKAIDELFAQ